MLVFPPILAEERYGKLAKAGSYLPPLGLLYLASTLENEGKHTVRVLDGSIYGINIEYIANEITKWKPDIVGISSYTSTFYRSLVICELVKKINSKIITVLGGPHPTAFPQDVIKNKFVDFIVIGEGEITFKELIESIENETDISKVKGIGYKQNGKIKFTLPRERIDNLDILPFPDRGKVDLNKYRPSLLHYKRKPVFSIMCGRGCPYKCTYCSCAKVFHGKVTMRSPENVISEIKYLIEKYNAKEIIVYDDTFGLFRNWVIKFCDLIKPLKLTWSAWMRVDLVDPHLLKKMADSGCWHISYGVESGNQTVLNIIKKGINLTQIKNAFKWTHQVGIEARGTFMLGLPGDSWSSIMDTVNIAIKIKADYAQFQLLTPFPGTELWDTINQYGDLLIKDFSKYTMWFPVFIPKSLKKEDLYKAHRLAYRKFYIRLSYILQRLMKIRSFQDIKRYFTGFISILEYFFLKQNN